MGKLPLGDVSKHAPDVTWLLTVLSTLNPRHRYFLRSYKAPPKKTKKAIAKPQLKLPPDFMKDLPPIKNLAKVS